MWLKELRRRQSVLLVALILAMFFINNQPFCQNASLKIGISKASLNYLIWLKRADSSIQTVDLYYLPITLAVQELSLCNGLLLTGGEDVWPGRYGKEYDTLRCIEMNPHRDSLDMALIETALAKKIPVIGICRGHQILNVYLGGTLIIDIPEDFGTRITHQCDDYQHCFHAVNVRKASMLGAISKCDSARVTTNHHQAVDHLSPIFIANAWSDDNLIEGIEWQDPEGKSFLLGVQWHPERMDLTNPLSGLIADEFIRQATTYAIQHQKKQKP